jgi:hypothetical protein
MPYVGIQQYKGPPTPILSPRRIQPDGTNLIICSMRPFAFYLITLRSSDNLQLTNKGFLELHYLKKDVTRLTKNLRIDKYALNILFLKKKKKRRHFSLH